MTFSVFSPFGRLLASARAAEKLLPSAWLDAWVVPRSAVALRAEWIETTSLILPVIGAPALALRS